MFADLLRSALGALGTHRLRTSLSVLGIVIGVAAVVATISLVSGATAQMKERIAGLGIRTITINVFPTAIQSAAAARALTQELTDRLAAADYVSLVVPIAQARASLVLGTQSRDLSLLGVTPNYPLLFDNFYPASGRFIHELDEGQKVAVLGAGVAKDLFPEGTAVGETLTLELGGQKVAFRVVGVMVERGTVGNQTLDDYVYVPLSTLQTLTGSRQFTTYIAQAVDAESVEKAASAIEGVLAATFASVTAQAGTAAQRAGPTAFAAPAFAAPLAFTRTQRALTPYSVTVQKTMIATYEESVRTMTLVLASVAAISLLVGGIGIMNIMLVSVAERTREIGIRMAVGARPRDIRNQFLLEAVVICLFGGLLGLGVGWLAAWLGALFGRWPFVISGYPALLAVGFSAAVGLIFGLYPAVRASRLDPVEALRYE
ncbi:ABC transporter permease [Candidatus Bipolaricaulota bacterium]|nr:ABC transporter permease [Candidatus Bipolaricaulota bacterium]